MELQNRLKASTVEVKMFNLKVKTLQSENWRLKEQVSDHAKVLAELESAKAQVKLLNEKIRYEAEQNREQIVSLQQKVSRLQDQQCKDAACDQDIQIKLQKLKDLESEAEELRKSNLRLHIENSHLVRRLDSTQILANAVLEDPEVDAVKQESECLKQENVRLMKEIEQLHSDRCSDLEELVYMRWINACLRYELRNFEAPPGKMVAKDFSGSFSSSVSKGWFQIAMAKHDAEGGSFSAKDYHDPPPRTASGEPVRRVSEARGVDRVQVQVWNDVLWEPQVPREHACGFDFKAVGREEIARANPVIKGEKLRRI